MTTRREIEAKALTLTDEELNAFLSQWDRSENLGEWNGRTYIVSWGLSLAGGETPARAEDFEVLTTARLAVIVDGQEADCFVDELPSVGIPKEIAPCFRALTQCLEDWSADDDEPYPEARWKEAMGRPT